MALILEDFLSGVETGTFDDSTNLSGTSTIETVNPITGTYSITCSGTNTGTAQQWPFTTTMAVSIDKVGNAFARFRFRINSVLPSNDTPFCGFGSNQSATIVVGEIKSTGEFRVNTGSGGVGAYSTAQLAVDTVYIAELQITVRNPSVGDKTHSGALAIYDNTGTIIESVSDSGISAFLDSSIKALFVGWGGAGSKTADYTYDDIQVTATTDDGTPVALTTTKTHNIFAVPITGAGAATDWTGTFADVDEIPFNPADVNEQTASGIEDTETYIHDTAAVLLITDIEAVKVSILAKCSTSSQTHAVMIDGVEFGSVWPTSYERTVVGTDLSSISNATFDALEYGVRNKTGTATTTANAVLMQVLAGTALTEEISYVF